jgi:hypothetical protein
VSGELVGNLNAIMRQPHLWSAEETRAHEAYADVIGLLLGLAAKAATSSRRVAIVEGADYQGLD